MVEIYKYISDSDTFESVQFKDHDEPVRRLFSKGEAASWPREVIDLNVLKSNRKGEFPSLYGWIPVFSEKAWDILKFYIGPAVQVIPVTCNGECFFLVNVIEVIPCLDHQKSVIQKNSITGQVSSISNHYFNTEMLQGKYIFKIPETKGLEVYITDKFKSIVSQNNLEGLTFDKRM